MMWLEEFELPGKQQADIRFEPKRGQRDLAGGGNSSYLAILKKQRKDIGKRPAAQGGRTYHCDSPYIFA